MYFALTIMLFVRFDAFSGTDNLREYRAAEITLAQGWNTPGSIQSANLLGEGFTPYLSCVSVTLLPAIFSTVSGLNLITIFRFGLSAIICLKPVLVYLNVKEVFKKREVAALSAVIYSQLYFVLFSYNTRQSIATVFLLCALLIFFKLMRTQKKAYIPLLCVFVYGVVSSHYTTAYFLNMILFVFVLSLCIISILSKKRLNLLGIDPQKLHVGKHFAEFTFIVCAIVTLVWFSTVPTSPFFRHFALMIRYPTPPSDLPLHGLTTSYLVGSPLGPLIDSWFMFEMVLAIAGFLFLALRVKKNLKMLLWFSAGGLFFSCFLTTFIPYRYLDFGDFTRFYLVGYPFLCVFVALILLTLDKRSKGVVLILFLLLNLPMNMLLPIHYRYVLYHPEESISPDLAVNQAYVKEAEFEIAKWTRNYVSEGVPLSVDHRGFFFMYYTNNNLYLCKTLNFSSGSEYLVLHYFTIKYGLWVFEADGGEVRQSNQTCSLVDSNNVIYNNGQGMLLVRK